MSYRRRISQSSRGAPVEIIPLIDVMFLLLCFFVYATMNMVLQKGISVNLASSTTYEEVEGREEPITLSVDKDSKIYFNKEPITREELLFYLRGLKETGQEKTVIISADKDATHGQVIALLDIVRRSGLREAVFAVEAAEER